MDSGRWMTVYSVRSLGQIKQNSDVDTDAMVCRKLHMATNLALDDNLIIEAQKIGQHKTKRDAVTQALIEYIQKHKQDEIQEIFGKIDYDSSYDYKKLRK